MSDKTTPRACWMHEYDDDTIHDTPEAAVHGWCGGGRERGERTLELVRLDPVGDDDLRVIAQRAAALAWDYVAEACYEHSESLDDVRPTQRQRGAMLDLLLETLRDQRMCEEVERLDARAVLGAVFDDILDDHDAELADDARRWGDE